MKWPTRQTPCLWIRGRSHQHSSRPEILSRYADYLHVDADTYQVFDASVDISHHDNSGRTAKDSDLGSFRHHLD